MATPDDLGPLLPPALASVLRHLEEEDSDNGDSRVPADLKAQIRLFQRLKGERGRKAVAEALGLHEAELPFLDAALRDVDRAEAEEESSRNAVLARLRLLSWLETIGQRTPALALGTDVDAALSEDLGRKQVRAVELIVRSLITESYGSQDALLSRLREALNEQVVSKWKRSADPGDILSGCSFSELASLFVNKEEFARYEKLYEDTPFLTLLKQRRKTIQSFLDDIRRVRNVLAHNKNVTPIQLSLLDLYYEEIITPIQTAHDHGETEVDPTEHLDVSKEDLEAYVSGLHEDVRAVQDDLAAFRTEVMASLGIVEERTERIEEQSKAANRKLYYIAGGVVVAIVLVVLGLMQGEDTQKAVEDTASTAKRTEEAARETAQDVSDLKKGQTEVRDASKAAAEAAKESAATSKETAEATKKTAEATKKTAEATEEIAKGVEETAKEVAENTEKVDEATKEMADASAATKEAAKGMEAATEKVVQTLEELRAGFSALTQQGGIIATPKRPQEYYHNAHMYEERGDYAKAVESYVAFFGFQELVFVDPHLRFQSFLKLQRGLAGARELYFDLKKGSDNIAIQFAWNLLLEGDARAEGLDAFIKQHPDFAPAVYARSRDFSLARLGSQAVADKRQEKELLTRYLALKDSGPFLKYYLDQSVAVEQISDAEERLAAVSTMSDEALQNPVQISGYRAKAHWTLTISVGDMPTEIFYKLDNMEDFKSMGVQPGMRSYSGNPIPKMTITIPHEDRTQIIQIKYKDQKGAIHGPYDVEFDPEKARFQSVKHMLDSSKSGWISLQEKESGPPLLYFSGLLVWRSIIKEIRFGINTETPDEIFEYPAEDPDNPMALSRDNKFLPYKPTSDDARFAVVQLVLTDGTVSEVVKTKLEKLRR